MKKGMFLTGALALVLLMAALSLAGCAAGGQSALVDGYYTAQMADFSRGWKEYVTICVNGGDIASVEFNAVNSSGFIKAWDMAYMRNMSADQGMYPNLYTRQYAKQLMERQSADGIDAISGATVSGENFQMLAVAVIQLAARGADEVAVVGSPAETAKTPEKQSAKKPAATPQPAPVPTPAVTPAPTVEATPAPTVEATSAPTAEPAPAATAEPAPVPAEAAQPAAADAVSSATVEEGGA